MKSEKTEQPNGEIVLKISLDKNEAKECYNASLSNISSGFSKKGFRPGNVPKQIVEKAAQPQIMLEYEQAALRKCISKTLDKEKIVPVLRPEVKILKSAPGQIFECEVKVVAYPEVQLSDYKNLKLKRKKVKIEEKEIDKAIEFLRQSRASFKPKDGPAKDGDQIEISFDAFHKGKKIPEASTPYYPVRLGKKQLHPEFEKNLIGLKTDEEKSFSIDYPKDWAQETYRDKKIDFKVKTKAVSETILPKLDDQFAKSLGPFEGMPALKKSLRDGLTQEKESQETKRFQQEILEKIIEGSKIKIPKILIEKEKETILKKMNEDLAAQKLTLDDYLKRLKVKKEKFDKDLERQAEKRLKGSFVINEIAKSEVLFPKDQEVEDFVNNELKKSANSQKNHKDIDLEKLRSYTFEYLTNQKVINWLTNICVRSSD